MYSTIQLIPSMLHVCVYVETLNDAYVPILHLFKWFLSRVTCDVSYIGLCRNILIALSSRFFPDLKLK